MAKTTTDSTLETPRGIHWTYVEVLRGKSGVIMAIDLILAVVLIIIGAIIEKNSPGYGVLFAELFNDLTSLKANDLAMEVCVVVVLFIPVMLVCWPIIAAILMVFYNVRDRKLARTPDNLEEHAIAATRAWTWPWSIIVGVFDFSASFSLFILILSTLGAGLPEAATKMFTVVFTVVCLVFAERRVTHAAQGLGGRRDGNRATIDAILNGRLDARIPEKFRTDLGRAKVATVIKCGIFRTPEWAARVVEGIDLRTRVKMFSGFLNSTIHGVLTAISFGIAATAANSLGYVGGRFGAGHGDEYIAELRTTPEKRPRFIIEIIAVVICVAVTTYVAITVITEGEAVLLG